MSRGMLVKKAADASAFRHLLRSSRRLDQKPELLAALLGRPARRYHPGLRKLVRIPAGPWPFVDAAVWDLCGETSEYALPLGGGQVQTAVRQHLMRCLSSGVPYVDDAEELRRRLQEAEDFAEEISDMECIKEQLTSASRTLPTLERASAPVLAGDVLVAHPLSCLFQAELDQAVVLVDEVEEEAGSVRGLVLNSPDQKSLKEALALTPVPCPELEPLLAAPLYIGGDLVMQAEHLWDRLSWLHSLGPKQLPGAEEVAPGIFLGGDLAEVARLLKDGQIASDSLRAVLGFVGWEDTQLELELERGVWIHLRPSAGVCCSPLLLHSEASKESIWRAALLAAELPALAFFPRGSDVDEKLRARVEAHAEAQVRELLSTAE